MRELIFKMLKEPFDCTVILLKQILNAYPPYISVPLIMFSIVLAWKIVILLLEVIVKKIENSNFIINDDGGEKEKENRFENIE